ncbi:MAG: hypothetical protein ACUVUT_05005, partial [Candidatus Bipolaricaulia bacterium]
MKGMTELVRRGLLLGLGALDLARERVESLADELIKRGELVQKEKATGGFGRLRATVERLVGELGLPTKADLA